jgi:hypothetical protein
MGAQRRQDLFFAVEGQGFDSMIRAICFRLRLQTCSPCFSAACLITASMRRIAGLGCSVFLGACARAETVTFRDVLGAETVIFRVVLGAETVTQQDLFGVGRNQRKAGVW